MNGIAPHLSKKLTGKECPFGAEIWVGEAVKPVDGAMQGPLAIASFIVGLGYENMRKSWFPIKI